MATHDHKPDGPRREATLWFYCIDTIGLFSVLGVHLGIGAAEFALITFFARRSWAFDPVPWIHGPPLDVPVGNDRFISYFYLLVWALVLTIGSWGACVAMSTWPGRLQPVLAVLSLLLVVPHLVILWSLL